jgi:hypothetical protein
MAGIGRTEQTQLDSLKAKYGAKTKRELLRKIRDDWNRECFDPQDTDLRWDEAKLEFVTVPAKPFTVEDADLALDGMLEAEYQKMMSR